MVVDAQPPHALHGHGHRDLVAGGHLRQVAHPLQESVGHARRAARQAGQVGARIGVEPDVEDARRPQEDAREVVGRVELEALGQAEAAAEGRRQQAFPRRRPDQGEAGQVDADAARPRALVDHDVDDELLHRRVEVLLDGRREAVDLVDEQHVAGLEVREEAREVGRLLEHGRGGLLEPRPELRRDQDRERRLAEPREAREQHVVERFASRLGGLDREGQVLHDVALADELVHRPGAQRPVERRGAAAPRLLERIGRGSRVRSGGSGALRARARPRRALRPGRGGGCRGRRRGGRGGRTAGASRAAGRGRSTGHERDPTVAVPRPDPPGGGGRPARRRLGKRRSPPPTGA